MEKETKRSIKLGVFVSVGLLLIIIAIYFVGRHKNIFGDTIVLNTLFRNVGGLQIGNNVRFSGINVGTVSDISIVNDTAVRVKMLIESNVTKFIKKDATAIIGSEGLMGNKIINIQSGSANVPSVRHNDYIVSVKSTDIDEIISNLNITTQNAAVITTDLAEIVYKVNNGEGAVSKFLFDSTLSESFEKSIANIEKGTSGFNQNMEALKHNFLLRRYFKKKEEDRKSKKEDTKAAIEEAKRKKEEIDNQQKN